MKNSEFINTELFAILERGIEPRSTVETTVLSVKLQAIKMW